jgi:tetratricopeptide (TPR) repeat protein
MTRVALFAGLLVAACAAVYWGVWEHEFVLWDDNANIYENPLVVPGPERSLERIWLEPYRRMYLPLVYSTAAIGAAFFGLHPLQVEPVAWASGMKDLLFALFALLSLYGYTAAAAPGAGGRAHGLRYGLATGAFAAALLAKPMAVVVPVLAGVLDVALLRRRWTTSARWLAPWLLLAAARTVPTLLLQPDASAGPVPWLHRPFLVGDTLTFYLAKLVLPVGLCIDYGRTPEAVVAGWWGYAAWIVPATLALVAWRQWRARPWIAASLAFFAVGLAPVSGILPFLFQEYSTVADRYVYLSMVGLGLFTAGALRAAGPLRLGAGLAAVVAFAVMSTSAAGHWRDSSALFSRVLEVNSGSAVAHGNLGAVALDAGRVDEAIGHLREAIRLQADSPAARKNLAMAWMQRGEWAKARHQLQAALEILPGYVELHFQWGRLHEQQGDPATAAAAYRTVLELSPEHTDAHVNLGTLLAKQGAVDAAERHFRAALRSNPRSAEAHANLGVLILQRGDAAGAIPHFETALELRPDFTQIEALLRQARARR